MGTVVRVGGDDQVPSVVWQNDDASELLDVLSELCPDLVVETLVLTFDTCDEEPKRTASVDCDTSTDVFTWDHVQKADALDIGSLCSLL